MAFYRRLLVQLAATKRRGASKRLISEGTKQLWRCMCVIVLNGLNTGWHFQFSPKGRVSESQKVAMEVVNRWVEFFFMNYLIKLFNSPTSPNWLGIVS